MVIGQGEKMNTKEIIKKQRRFFLDSNTISYKFRMDALKKLRSSIMKHELEIKESLLLDLGKNSAESYFTEIGQVLKEISYIEKNLKRLMKNKKVKSHLIDFPSSSFISPHPYGVTLIISPWNYPIMLTLGPLVGAIAAGNTAVIKPSEFSNYTSEIIEKIITSIFDEEYVKVMNGGVEVTKDLLEQKFDYIFFTGSTNVGRIIMEKASKYLTPISLELGGKSPVIVDIDANLRVAAKRIAFGKYINAGQTCVAPDYVYIHESIKDEFITYFKESVHEFFGENPIESKDFGKIINTKHYQRLTSLIDGEDITFGGVLNERELKISPTILENINHNSKIMQEEIFGPILPILTYTDINNVIMYINSNPNPLALYLFTEDKKIQQLILDRCKFGGGCINDTVVQVGSDYLPFGGVGESGMGAYHGTASFETFSHYRSILRKSTKLDIKARYAPYNDQKEKLTKVILK